MKGLLIISLLLLPVAAWASGTGHHHDHTHHHDGGHMAAMQAVKEKIPADYRVMDRSPVTPTQTSLASGAELFRQNCAVCHGEQGRGDGPAAQGMATRPANFRDAHHSNFYGPGERYWIIGNGLDSGMPAFKESLTPRQRWDLVNHILKLTREDADALFD